MKTSDNAITWQQLKEFVNTLTDEELQNKVPVLYQDEERAKFLLEPFRMEQNILAHIDDDEVCGTMEELKDRCKVDKEPFNENEYYVCTKQGTPFLWID